MPSYRQLEATPDRQNCIPPPLPSPFLSTGRKKFTKRTQSQNRTLPRASVPSLARFPCPSCVGPVGEIGARGKEAAGRILGALLEGQ